MRIKINTQVEGVVNDCTIDDMVHNGTRLMNEGEENFMTETKVLKCMKGLYRTQTTINLIQQTYKLHETSKSKSKMMTF